MFLFLFIMQNHAIKQNVNPGYLYSIDYREYRLYKRMNEVGWSAKVSVSTWTPANWDRQHRNIPPQKMSGLTIDFVKSCLFTLLMDGNAPYVYNNKHCSRFPGQLS